VLLRFVNAYQRVQPLTIGELWAVAITLRVVLVENLRRLAESVVAGRRQRREADALADAFTASPDAPAEPLLRRLESKSWERPFAVQLIQRLREHPEATAVFASLERRLAEEGTSSEELVRAEHQTQGALNVTVRNVITSMRHISSFDWKEFFESVSLVDQRLRARSAFASMDFKTRDRYRHAIEDLSRGSDRSELEVAEEALAFAARAPRPGMDAVTAERRRDPGYWLISKGRPELEARLRYRPAPLRRLVQLYVSAGLAGYAGGILLGERRARRASAERGAARRRVGRNLGGDRRSGILHGDGGGDPAREPLRRGDPHAALSPEARPRARSSGVDADARRGAHDADRRGGGGGDGRPAGGPLPRQPARDLRFALLTDWLDADREEVPGDAELLRLASEGVARLNDRHGPMPQGDPRFLLLHRRRLWNEREGKVDGMGAEARQDPRAQPAAPRPEPHELPRPSRCAGASSAVRRALRDHARQRHAPSERGGVPARRGDGPSAQPRALRSQGGARDRGVRGPPAADHAVASRARGPVDLPPAHVGPGGDRSLCVGRSEAYQDLFGEGSYAGKGIYEVAAFEDSLAHRVPENALLSHDLFEGTFARAGSTNDIELVEDFRAATRWGGAAVTLDPRRLAAPPWVLGLREMGGRARTPRARSPRSAAGRCSTTCAAR
jgi:cyclic beta-1,2-glucan synthetase